MKLNDSKLQERIKWQPFEAQQEIINAYDRVRHIRLAAGTRFGKSELCAYFALRELLKDNKHIWIVAPSYNLTGKVFEKLTRMIGIGFPALARGISRRPFPKVETPWGSWVECKSAENPTDLLGEELDLVIIDEAAKLSKKIWDEYLEDRLSTRQGKSVFISTPWGRNWFYQEWLKARRDKNSAAFQFETIENPYFPKEEWERLKNSKNQDLFNQNFRARFLATAASFFRDVRECIAGEKEDYKLNHYYTMGIDWAKLQDFTVFTIIDRTTHQLVYLSRMNGVNYTLQMARAVEVAKKYRSPEIWMDTTGLGEVLSDVLKTGGRGLNIRDYKFTNKSKEALLEKLSIWISELKITYPNIEVLIDELEVFGAEYSDSGRLKLSAPEGMHDDCVISLALAVWPLLEHPTTKEDAEPIIPERPNYK